MTLTPKLKKLYTKQSQLFLYPSKHRPVKRRSVVMLSSNPVGIDIVLKDADDRAMVDVKQEKNRREKVSLYMDGESVMGTIVVRPKEGKRVEHTGIKVQFIGTIGTVPNLTSHAHSIR